ncbi:putative MFS peptide transporter [Aspergillus brunneoviolaceus CBS 621.78]|uniref:MFS peptide transporter n=2 Tax=Aspergillus TaxID=5052 RepID=A0A8G1W1A4_9EURO|nr:MFS peptide transporter [Aspergillus brunneoviolaceus CBS 621.78]XP_040803483.1 MFS peptide transporter [Aspergillus fijiensis CBS 313.89]RAH41310.1 MFS peptide transporter [Aspergillus brunneoviolaceus CBS 621.78]RAK79473.1 MFS peptide transporter [Aspergillus fijiensis CBS 313.89]
MSDPVGPDDLVYVAQAHVPQKELQTPEKEDAVITATRYDDDGREIPTVEEEQSLRRVAGKVKWTAYTIAFVELCERFSYYGTTAVYTNFIQQPLPAGSDTGAGGSGQSGALGQGQRTSTALTTFNTFWCYVMPILGAWIADEYWGRMKTIQVAIAFAMLGHIIIIISSIPQVITNTNGALACFCVGLVFFGIGVGGFKSNISPLIAEQHRETKLWVKTEPKTGERVIVDPAQTITRIFLYFYFMINVGSLIGSVAMVYAEKYVGYWLAYLLPTIMFGFCPLVLFACRNKYHVTPPTGSVAAKAFKLWGLALKRQWTWNPVVFFKRCQSTEFWDGVKPSQVENKPHWMTFDDQWVDEVRRAVKACAVFAWYPLYWLAYGQMTNNLTSQAATMQLHGVPNDIINNLDPLALIIFIPIMDQFVYPGLRKMGINFTPIKRIYVGYLLAAASMIAAAVTQYYIYKLSPCGDHPSTCDEAAPINVWVQTVPYVLIAFSEIFTSITGYEYAYTKAPKNMKSLVSSLYLFMNAISSAIQQGLTALSTDPLLIWNYGFVAVLAFIGGNLFYLSNLKLDKEEDELNNLEESQWVGQNSGESEKTVA